MTARIQSIVLSKNFFTSYSSNYQTKSFSTFISENTKSDSSNTKFLSVPSQSTNASNSKKEMPVITAVAVVAHRQNHHDHPTHAIHKRFSLLNFSTSKDQVNSSKTMVKCNSFCSPGREFYKNLLDVNKMKGSFQPNIETRRFYAKGKDKSKAKKSVVNINEGEMGDVIDVDALKKQLQKNLEQMKEEFSKQLNVRGAGGMHANVFTDHARIRHVSNSNNLINLQSSINSTGALETLTVEYEGETYPLQELAQVGRKNPQLAVLNLSSLPDACQAVLKAIQDSGMNLNPQQEGTTIYVPLPK